LLLLPRVPDARLRCSVNSWLRRVIMTGGWTTATATDGGPLAVGFAGMIAVIAGRVGELYADARSAASLAGPHAGQADRRNTGS
jgi:hypothetical protein